MNEQEQSKHEDVEDWKLYFESLDISKPVEVTHKRFTGEVRLFDLYERLKFEDCVFEKAVYLDDLNAAKGITFDRCEIPHIISTTVRTKIRGNFLVENSVVNHFDFFGGEYDFCIWSFKRLYFLNIRLATFKQLSIGNDDFTQIENLILRCSLLTGDIILHGNTEVATLSITEALTQASITLQDIHVHVIDLYNFINGKDFRLGNIRGLEISSKKASFYITQSNLGSTEFYNINFQSFSVFNIYHSQMLDCKFTDIKWRFQFSSNAVPERSMNNSLNATLKNLEQLKGIDFSSYNYSRLREVYRQLKSSLGKQGDTVHEQHFHTMEMRSHLKSISGWKTWGTQFIIWCSYQFSNFGQTFVWPLGWLFLGHFLWFTLALVFNSFTTLHFTLSNPSWAGFNEGVYQYFLLLNPAHKITNDFHGWQIIIDIVMRVWSSYMIYNIIRATRRFLK